MHKNGTKVCPIAPIMTLQEYIWDKRERFGNNINYLFFCLIFPIILVTILSYIWSRILVKFYEIIFT